MLEAGSGVMSALTQSRENVKSPGVWRKRLDNQRMGTRRHEGGKGWYLNSPTRSLESGERNAPFILEIFLGSSYQKKWGILDRSVEQRDSCQEKETNQNDIFEPKNLNNGLLIFSAEKRT